MKTKLTLSIEKRVIEEAKILAREEGATLSALTENFFKQYVSRIQHQNYVAEVQAEYHKTLSPEIVRKLKTVEQLTGIFYQPDQDDRNYKQILQEELIKRQNKLNTK